MINLMQLIKYILTGRRAVTFQPYTEANVKNGLQFYGRRAFTGSAVANVTGGAFTATNQKRYIYFQTGSKTVIVKDRVVKYIGEEFSLRIYNATGEVAPTLAGSITVSNYRNDGVAQATTVSAYEVLESTAPSLGVEIDDAEYYFGSNAEGQRNSGSLLEGRERILPPNSKFFVEIELTAGNSGRFEYFLDWYEGEPDLPRKE